MSRFLMNRGSGGTGAIRVAGSRRGAVVADQPELWADERERAVETVVDESPVAVAPAAVAVRVAAPVRGAAVARREVVPAPVAMRGVPVQAIARFLNVNGAIEGMKPSGMRFDLPGRGLSRTLRLWRGSNEAATYHNAPM